MKLAANRNLEIDDQEAPSGRVRATKESGLDFSAPKTIGSASEGIVYYFCFDQRRDRITLVAKFTAPFGLALTVCSDKPVAQVFSGYKMTVSLRGSGGLCIEPSGYPNTPVSRHFLRLSTLLKIRIGTTSFWKCLRIGMNARLLFLLIGLTITVVGGARAQTLGPVPEFLNPDFASVELGRLLFYDPILSGNKNISCGTCHHPKFGTSDSVSLGIGEGGIGLGSDRTLDPENTPEQRVPRNSPGLWNLGAKEFTTFFHDGRLEADPSQPDGIRTPLGTHMRSGFKSALAAQAMFPVLSADEMAGHYSENDVSKAVRLGFLTQQGGAWDLIAERVAAIPEYNQRFDEIAPNDPITFTAIANVIADFIAFEWRADNSPFDRAMRGEVKLSEEVKIGMGLFYGKAGCSNCHSGWFQTDHKFHSIALPQIGPGKAARFENHVRDDGRLRVTGDYKDAFAFRTPSLRNVTLTAPYGHNGAFAELEDIVRHHLNAVTSLRNYSIEMAELPVFPGAKDQMAMLNNRHVDAIAKSNSLSKITLTDQEVDALLSFLASLEDPAERLGVPDQVPSGLPVDQ